MGGFIGVSEPLPGVEPFPNSRATRTNGRSALAAILAATRPSAVWMPHWQCPSVSSAIPTGVPVVRYALDDRWRPAWPSPPPPDAAVVLVNHLGLLDEGIAEVVAGHRGLIVLDDAQALFHRRPDGVWAFDSPRKFVGVPDGAHVFGPTLVGEGPPAVDPPTAHLVARARGASGALRLFHDAEESRRIDDAPMSLLSRVLLRTMDLAWVARRRRENFAAAHAVLGPTNRLRWVGDPGPGPLAYPYLPVRPVDRGALARERVWVPRFWPDLGDLPDREPGWIDALLPLPIDQRYTVDQIDRMAQRALALTEG